MHRPIFGHSFAVLVAPVLLSVLAFYFLNKKKASVRGNAEDVDVGASGLLIALTETNSGRSSLSPTEMNDGASSSSTTSTGSCYEVFLSFRGLDTRHGFTDHLYNGLIDAGIDVFRDNDELHQGENIRPELLAAITKSKILIPILSKEYGTSSWCLDELVQIMECKNNNGHIVLPIFYKVKPADVGHQIGSFGDAFRKREKRLLERHFDPTILEKWKKALLEVSTLKGYEADGSEAELVKSIVRKVLSELKKKFELVISENLVGIDSHVKEVMEFVNNKSHATLFVGIHGMGGIGKTTLAKAIYNKLSNQFEHHSFIADVRESCKRNGIHYLQNQLIYDILKPKNEVRNEDEGIQFISSKFTGKKVLVLLDDVDNVVQLKRLAGNRDWFSSGSRIIITTRNKRIIEEAAVDYDYGHKEMDNNQSLILFSKHAFRRDSPPMEFEDLAHEVVSITGGLPLSLEVFGSLLCGKESTQWRDTIKKLKKILHMEVQEKLLISYEALDDGQKQIFLDIACFFIGTDKRIASYMWDACDFFPGEGIEVLRFMSLIKIGDRHELKMHDQLRDLGREIVRKENERQPQYRSRLWDSVEALKVLKKNKGTDKIEAIYLHDFDTIAELDGNIYAEKQFKNLTSLRFLHVEQANLSGDFKDSMKGLRWLRYRQRYRWQYRPVNFEVKNFHVTELVVLELSCSEINEKWEGWSSFMVAKELKYLDLTCCKSLENTMFLSAFKHLEVLILNWCGSLKRIDPSIGDMKALLRLELSSCQSLVELPAEIGSLENLEILDIFETGIEELPEGIGRLRKLQELRASYCYNLKGKVPESMCNLSSLQRLDFAHCHQFQSLLPNLLPSSLTDLGVTCRSRKLPSLSHLTHLKRLRVWGCGEELPSTLLENSECSQPTDVEESELPQSLNTPFELEILEVSACRSIETLDVSQFVHLRRLLVEVCDNLLEVRGLDKLICLESLTVRHCDSIERLLLPKSKSLKELSTGKCEKLAEIQGLDRLEFLENLNIGWCTLIERLDLPKSGRLKILEVEGRKNLAEIQGLDRLEFLENLNIGWCTSIERLDLPKSGRLKILKAQGCKNLAEIQGLDTLEFLEELRIDCCTSIERLDLPKSGSLKILNARSCKKLAEIQGLDRLEFLESLDITECDSIERLDLPISGSLKTLRAYGCKKLAEIQGLDRLEFLESLDITECDSIERLDLPKSRSLKILFAGSCKKLAEIQGLDRLEFLESLAISECDSIKRLDLPKLASLSHLTHLKRLKVWGVQGLPSTLLENSECSQPTDVEESELPQSLNTPFKLEDLEIHICRSIKTLDVSQFVHIRRLHVEDCENLLEVRGLDKSICLESLTVTNCGSIERLLLPKSKSLKKLSTGSCKKLTEIQDLHRLEFLKSLDISKCDSIERLDLPKSGRLEILIADHCVNLSEIQGLDTLEFLEELRIIGCKSLKTIPELSGTWIYQNSERSDDTDNSNDQMIKITRNQTIRTTQMSQYNGNDPHFLTKESGADVHKS